MRLFYISFFPGVTTEFTQPAGNYRVHNMKWLHQRKKP